MEVDPTIEKDRKIEITKEAILRELLDDDIRGCIHNGFRGFTIMEACALNARRDMLAGKKPKRVVEPIKVTPISKPVETPKPTKKKAAKKKVAKKDE